MQLYSRQTKSKQAEMLAILRAEVLSLIDDKCYRELMRVKGFLLGEDIKTITGVKTTTKTITFKEENITSYMELIKPIVSINDPHYANCFKEVKK